MKRKLLILTYFLIVSTNLVGQINSTKFCKVIMCHIGLKPELYINLQEKVIKNKLDEFPLIDNFYLLDSNSFSTDTITELNPKETFIKLSDIKIDLSEFDTIIFNKFREIKTKIYTFEKEVDFNGDHLVDKIIITNSLSEEKNENEYYLTLYENQNGYYEKLENCGCAIWSKPLKIYVSEIVSFGMASILILTEGDKPEITKSLEIIFRTK